MDAMSEDEDMSTITVVLTSNEFQLTITVAIIIQDFKSLDNARHIHI